MSLRKYRGRRITRHSQAFSDNDEILQATDEIQENEPMQEDDPDAADADSDIAAKQQEIWDAFRDEHYEAVEQLPLSLHRAYALIKELDQQVQDNNQQLFETLKSYATVRTAAPLSTAPDVPMDVDEAPQSDAATNTNGNERMPTSADIRRSQSLPLSSTKDEASTRELLKAIARLSEDVMNASHEKLSLARFACDLIDRHSRDIERAIKEQETSLSVGLRPGTHPASIILPEVVVPPAIRAPRIVHSPVPEDEDPMEEAPPPPEVEATAEPVPEPTVIPEEKSTRKRGRGRPSRKKDGHGPNTPSSSPNRPGFKLTLRPLASVIADVEPAQAVDVDPPIDPNEPRYCYCNGVSAGIMIACEGPQCKYQWFHIECLQLKVVPEGDYLCPDCIHEGVVVSTEGGQNEKPLAKGSGRRRQKR
ncbi:hypothetical protein BDW22DRAFT_1360162 [Trametopsis cervina]|nr:hypothetical protein BDW22DRAFT_1360162 [Trametopsis cervina]